MELFVLSRPTTSAEQSLYSRTHRSQHADAMQLCARDDAEKYKAAVQTLSRIQAHGQLLQLSIGGLPSAKQGIRLIAAVGLKN